MQQNSVSWPKWQTIAVEHVGNTQRAKYSSTIMRDPIRGRPPCFGAQQHLCKRSSALAVLTRRHRGKTCATLKKYVTTDRYQVRPNEGQRYRENGLTANILKYFIYLFQERFNPPSVNFHKVCLRIYVFTFVFTNKDWLDWMTSDSLFEGDHRGNMIYRIVWPYFTTPCLNR
jgi:hypothetical protein